MSSPSLERIGVYIDGFNLYHAIHELGQNHLKWVNLRRLSEYLIRRKSQRIVSIKYFSAFANHFSGTTSVDKLLRHRAYVAALECKGIACHMGNFAKRDRVYVGRGYKARWRRYEEKQTDVGIGVHLIHDAHADVFDRALVVSVDTDLMPAFRLMKVEFPTKPVICVAPPKRSHHRDIQAVVAGCEVIKVSQIEKSLFGPSITKDGRTVARRPAAYRLGAAPQNMNGPGPGWRDRSIATSNR